MRASLPAVHSTGAANTSGRNQDCGSALTTMRTTLQLGADALSMNRHAVSPVAMPKLRHGASCPLLLPRAASRRRPLRGGASGRRATCSTWQTSWRYTLRWMPVSLPRRCRRGQRCHPSTRRRLAVGSLIPPRCFACERRQVKEWRLHFVLLSHKTVSCGMKFTVPKRKVQLEEGNCDVPLIWYSLFDMPRFQLASMQSWVLGMQSLGFCYVRNLKFWNLSISKFCTLKVKLLTKCVSSD
jgi:hypothetical protein